MRDWYRCGKRLGTRGPHVGVTHVAIKDDGPYADDDPWIAVLCRPCWAVTERFLARGVAGKS
mgnify:CR=1 FL=1